MKIFRYFEKPTCCIEEQRPSDEEKETPLCDVDSDTTDDFLVIEKEGLPLPPVSQSQSMPHRFISRIARFGAHRLKDVALRTVLRYSWWLLKVHGPLLVINYLTGINPQIAVIVLHVLGL
jgi:hypothetical protein